MEQPRFANGRRVRNAIEQAHLRHASRVVNGMDKVGKDDLMRIEAEDIPKSPVFADQDEGMYDHSGDGSESDGKGDSESDSEGGAEAKSEDGKAEDGKAEDGKAESEEKEKEEAKA